MAYIHNGGSAYMPFPTPNGNPGMMNHQNRQYGLPRFNNCPWGPPPERPNFNINRFMQPPHVARQDFVPDNSFRQDTMNRSHENFPFNSHQNNHQATGQHFQGHPGWGRGFTRGHHGGQGFRGGFRGGYNNNNNNNNNSKQQNHTKKKKEKVNKRDLPENNAFFCDICDRGYKTPEKFQEHMDGHIQCSFKGCPFVAAPKLVQLHIRIQHSSGLAKKVWSMESEEDIRKWRDERKKNYPTADTVTKKVQEREERIARGEVIQTKDFGKMRGRGRNRHDRRGRGWKNGNWKNHNNNRNNSETRSECGSDNDSPPEEIKIKRSDATGEVLCKSELNALDNISGAPSNTDGNASEISSPKKEPPLVASGTSLALIVSYEDSSSDAEVLEERTADSVLALDVSNTQTVSQPSVSSSPTRKLPDECAQISSSPSSATMLETSSQQLFLNGDPCQQKESSQEFNKNEKHEKKIGDGGEPRNESSPRNDSNRHQKERQATGGKRGSNSREGCSSSKKMKHSKPQLSKYTLLQKLLAPDIRRERNKILQCVHYLVKNRFFVKEQVNEQILPDAELSS